MGLISYVFGGMLGRRDVARAIAKQQRDTGRCPCCGQALPRWKGRP